MADWLHTQGDEANRKRVTWLLRLMELEAIYPKPRLSQRGTIPQKYPYLLKRVSIDRTNYVWSMDRIFVWQKASSISLPFWTGSVVTF